MSQRRRKRGKRGTICTRIVLALVSIFLLVPASQAAAAGTLTINLAGTGTGKVTSADGFINCSNIVGEEATECSHTYSSGSATLTATNGTGSTFSGWTSIGIGGGSCTGGAVTNPCTTGGFAFGAPSITATFEVEAEPPQVKINPVEPPITPCTSAPTATEACFSGEVNPEGADTKWWFEYREVGASTWSKAPTPEGDAGDETSFVPVSTSAEGLEPNTEYEVKLVAKSPGGEPESTVENFETVAGSPAAVTGLPFGVGATTANLTGTVNPRNSEVTACHFQVVPLAQFETDEFASVAPSQEAPCVPAPGSGGTAVEVGAAIAGLQAEAAYRYRLLATNVGGTGEGLASSLFTYPLFPNESSCPNSDLRLSPFPSFALGECRAYELVTSADKHGADAMTSPLSTQIHVDFFPLAVPGTSQGSVTWMDKGTAPNPLPDGGAENWYLSTRDSAAGWQVESLGRSAPPGGEPEFRLEAASADLSSVLLKEVIVDFSTSQKSTTGFFFRDPAGTMTRVAPAAAEAGSDFELSPDGSHLFFVTKARLLGEDTTETGARQLYEWTKAGGLRLAGLDGEGHLTSACGAVLAGLQGKSESVSSDGGRVLFQSPDPTMANPPSSCKVEGRYASDLYLREGGTTVDISKPPSGTPDHGAAFVGATPDLSQVFFVTETALPDDDPFTPEKATEGPGNADLYRYETATGQLTRLSVSLPGGEANAGVSPNVSTNGLATSALVAEEGSAAYFLACGRLVPGSGRTCAENGSGRRNLYLWRSGRDLTFVANLRGGGNASPSSAEPLRTEVVSSSLSGGVAAVDHNGSALVFSSASRLSGYDNRETSALYRYEADRGQIDCISCSPTGIPILGDVNQAGGAGRGPAFRTNFVTGAASRALPYSHYGGLSADGSTVVFATTDQLLPQATNVEGVQKGSNGIYDVYAWHDGRLSLVSTGRSSSSDFLIGTSATGSDVYFLTGSRLVPQDGDNAYDIYDARIGGGYASPEPSPPPCTGADCRGAATRAPAGPGAASAVFAGAGNALPSRDCSPLGRRARNQARRAQRLRRHARPVARHDQRRAAAMRRKAKRLSAKARHLNKNAKSCRRADRGGRK